MAKEPPFRKMVVLNHVPSFGVDTCRFQVTQGGMMMVGDEITTNAFGQFKMDGRIVRQMLEEFLQGVVKMRFEELGGDKIVAEIVERRVEVAVKRASEGLDRELQELSRTVLRKRIAEEIEKMPIELAIKAQ